MSDKEIIGKPSTGATEANKTAIISDPPKDVKPIEASSEAAVKPKVKPGYTNPAFKAMGIPPLRLPSRNWSIFWLVVSGAVGGYAYDRYQQKQIRKKWMDRVAHYGTEPLDPFVKARKVTVYMAPPPNDFLSESMTVFRKYIKPVLNAGGVDFEIRSENRQGVIRSTVAAEIRKLRREMLENETKLKELEESKKWKNKLKAYFSRSKSIANEDELKDSQEKAQFNYNNLLGVYYNNIHKDSPVTSEDSIVSDPSSNGGVICVGRGAYKEYLTGLHEGLLGPLEKPDDVEVDVVKTDTEKKQKNDDHEIEDKSKVEVSPKVEPPSVKALDEVVKEDVDGANPVLENTMGDKKDVIKNDTEEVKNDEENVDEDGEKLLPIPKPYIQPSDYKKAKLAPELNYQTSEKIPTESRISPVFQQPILVIPVYHLLGFLHTPERIYRFYTERYNAEKFGKSTCALVENLKSNFRMEDVDLAKDEESDWPKKWVEAGKEKGSEWVQELQCDERILEKLFVYDAERVKEVKE